MYPSTLITSKPSHCYQKSQKTPLLETNGMSTQVFGEYDNVMTAVQKERSSFLLGKIGIHYEVINSHLQEKPSI